MMRSLGYLIFGFLLGVAINAGMADVRVEAGLGKCSYSLAPDSSWRYEYSGTYQINMNTEPRCGQIGLLWKPKASRFGLRLAYVDLGTVTADNTFPTDEQAYFAAKDNRTAPPPADGHFVGAGSARGITLGPVYEHPVGKLTLSGEVGGALLYNTWVVPTFDWDYANGWNTTWYAGIGVRWKYLYASLRRYANVHASQADDNYQFIGPTAGDLQQITFGVSVPL